LYDLSKLLAGVEQSKYLVVLLTLRVLTRPWCLLEIVTAHKAGKELIPVKMVVPQQKQFDFMLFEAYKIDLKTGIIQTLTRFHGNAETAADEAESCVRILEEKGHTVNDVQAAICRLSEKIAKDLNLNDAGGDVITAQVQEIIKQMEV